MLPALLRGVQGGGYRPTGIKHDQGRNQIGMPEAIAEADCQQYGQRAEQGNAERETGRPLAFA